MSPCSTIRVRSPARCLRQFFGSNRDILVRRGRPARQGAGYNGLRYTRPDHRYVARVKALCVLLPIPAAADQKIDDVIAYAVIERMPMHPRCALGSSASGLSTISASTALGPLVISTMRSA